MELNFTFEGEPVSWRNRPIDVRAEDYIAQRPKRIHPLPQRLSPNRDPISYFVPSQGSLGTRDSNEF